MAIGITVVNSIGILVLLMRFDWVVHAPLLESNREVTRRLSRVIWIVLLGASALTYVVGFIGMIFSRNRSKYSTLLEEMGALMLAAAMYEASAHYLLRGGMIAIVFLRAVLALVLDVISGNVLYWKDPLSDMIFVI